MPRTSPPPVAVQTGIEAFISPRPYHARVAEFKATLIIATIQRHRGNIARAAAELGLARTYLHRIIRQLHIDTSVIVQGGAR